MKENETIPFCPHCLHTVMRFPVIPAPIEVPGETTRVFPPLSTSKEYDYMCINPECYKKGWTTPVELTWKEHREQWKFRYEYAKLAAARQT